MELGGGEWRPAPGFDALFGVAFELGQHLRGEYAAPVFGDDNQVIVKRVNAMK